MDEERARALLRTERLEVQRALDSTISASREDQETKQDLGDETDPGRALTDEAVDDAAAVSLRDRLAALDRAEERLAQGTYGLSVRSGRPIPDERLEADPAAELTVEEAENRP
jgi:DnaK suppressor protein